MLLLVTYLFIHFLLRLSFGPVLALDDAEQALFAQQWSWSYRFEQPPLFTWLLVLSFDLMGVDPIALAVWRYFWLAVIFLGSYCLLLSWCRTKDNEQEDRFYAALGTLSLLLIYVLAYFSHHDLTHTTIMTAFIVLALLQFTRLIENPGWFNYFLLGCVFAGGLLGKWNYVIFCLALTLTCLLLPRYRPLFWTPKTLLALMATVLLVLPTLLFVANLERPYVEIAQAALANDNVMSVSELVGKGSLKLFSSLLVYLLPFLLFILIFLRRPLGAGLGQLKFKQVNADTDLWRGPVSPQFLVVFTVAGILLLWLLIPVLGALRFTERWMQPVLFPLPFLLMMLIRAGRPAQKSINRYVVAIAVFSLLVVVVRIGMHQFSANYCGSCRALIPFPELSAQLRESGFQNGTIMTDRFHIGGNMRVNFPGSRVINPQYPMPVWSAEGSRSQCLLVWETKRGAQPPSRFQSFLADELNAEWRLPDQHGSASALLHGSTQREFSLSWWLYQQPLGDCH